MKRRVLLIGCSGTVGAAVLAALNERGHDVTCADYESVDLKIDITDTSSIAEVYRTVGKVDAVMCTVGEVPIKKISEFAKADVEKAVPGKLISQIDIVLQGLKHVRAGGSFTLVSGVMSRMPWLGGIGASIANGGIDAFVLGAAAEIGKDRRINSVSPTILIESVRKLGANLLPGHKPIAAADVADAYIRSLEGIETGKTFVVGY